MFSPRCSALVLALSCSTLAFAQGALPLAPPLPIVVSTTDLKAATQRSDIFERDGGFGFSVNGTSFWVFDDTGTGTVTPTGIASNTFRFLTNSASATRQKLPTNGVDLSFDYVDGSDNMAQFIPYSDDENKYNREHVFFACTAPSYCGSGYAIWPLGATFDPVTKQVFVSFTSFLRGGNVPSGEGANGISVGKMDDTKIDGIKWPVMTRPPQGTDAARPTLLWSKTDVTFSGSAFVRDGFYYQFGETQKKDPNCNPYWCVNDYYEHLAKVPVNDVLDRSKWLFYSADGTWSSSQSNLATLFVSKASNSVSIYYNDYLGEWMATYLNQLDNHAFFRVAKTMEGTWSAEAPLFAGEKPNATKGNNLDYALRAHRSLSTDGGRTMFFHYSRDIDVDGYTAVQGQDLPVEEVIFARP